MLVAALRFDPEQRFTCSQCGRCCRRGWDISVTVGEVEAYRRARAERWFRDEQGSAEGTQAEPFEPIPGLQGHYRIRKRPDGACGFLSPENRCRIHEELGAARKPLSCRLFPFRIHPGDRGAVVTASFCCPTVVKNEGAPLLAQSRELSALAREWSAAYPEAPRPLAFVAGRTIDRKTLATLRSILRTMLDRPGPSGGPPDLRANVGLMARLLEDLSRHRVVRLPSQAFAEYLELTGGHAAESARPPTPRPASTLGRLLSRGFLFAVVAARQQIEDGRSSGLRLGLRLRLLRLLAHFHGLGPGVAGVDLRKARRVALDLDDPAQHALVHNYLRSAIETLGTGRRPVLEELAVTVAFLNAGLLLAAARAGRAGRGAVATADLIEGLMEASDLTHAESRSLYGSLLPALSGGLEALSVFAEGAREK